jgi:hypothetical protein
MTTTITIKDKSVNTTYQNVTGLTGGSGDGATFDVIKTEGVYSVSLDSLTASSGHGYAAGDTITLAGTALGGALSNNLIVTVGTVGTLGKVSTFSFAGTGQIGDGTVDVVVDVTGTSAVDTYTFNDASTVHGITKNTNDITITSTVVSNFEVKLADHERVVFTNKAIAFDVAGDGHAGDMYALLSAALGVTNVTSTFEGIGIYLEDAGYSKETIAQALLNTTVYKTIAGGSSNETFVKQIYNTIVGRAPTLTELNTFTGILDDHTLTQAQLLVKASELSVFETTIGLVGLATTGIDYIPFVG